MDKTFLIKLIRVSDGEAFKIGDGSTWKLLSGGLDGFGEINNTISYEDNAITDGGHFTAEHVTKVDRTIKFTNIDWRNNDIRRRQLLQFIHVKDEYKVYITHGKTERWAQGKIYKFNVGTTADVYDRLDVTLTLLFESPYWNSVDDFGKNIAALTPLIAFPYLCSVTEGTAKGYTGGVFDFSQSVNIYNDGDANTYCHIIISADSGEVENPKILINGEYIRVIDTMAKGDEIDIDFTAFPPTVKKGGVNYIGHCDRTSAFNNMVITRGNNTIEYDADNGSNHMNVTICYFKKYEVV